MEVTEHVDTSVQLWSNRAAREHHTSASYHSELRGWVQRAVLEAERNKDSRKKGQLIGLLDDL